MSKFTKFAFCICLCVLVLLSVTLIGCGDDTYRVHLFTSDGAAGSASGEGYYEHGTSVTVTATPNPGYLFTGWYNFGSDTLASSDANYTFTITQDCTLTAKFELDPALSDFSYTLTTTACSITGIKDKTKTECTIPNSVTSIADDAFRDCTNLTSVTIGNGVKTIGFRAFKDCTALTNMTSPSSVTSIGNSAFYGCKIMRTVAMGNRVTSIGDSAFFNCSGLTEINYRGTQTQWNAISKGNSWSNGAGHYTVIFNHSGE